MPDNTKHDNTNHDNTAPDTASPDNTNSDNTNSDQVQNTYQPLTARPGHDTPESNWLIFNAMRKAYPVPTSEQVAAAEQRFKTINDKFIADNVDHYDFALYKAAQGPGATMEDADKMWWVYPLDEYGHSSLHPNQRGPEYAEWSHSKAILENLWDKQNIALQADKLAQTLTAKGVDLVQLEKDWPAWASRSVIPGHTTLDAGIYDKQGNALIGDPKSATASNINKDARDYLFSYNTYKMLLTPENKGDGKAFDPDATLASRTASYQAFQDKFRDLGYNSYVYEDTGDGQGAMYHLRIGPKNWYFGKEAGANMLFDMPEDSPNRTEYPNLGHIREPELRAEGEALYAIGGLDRVIEGIKRIEVFESKLKAFNVDVVKLKEDNKDVLEGRAGSIVKYNFDALGELADAVSVEYDPTGKTKAGQGVDGTADPATPEWGRPKNREDRRDREKVFPSERRAARAAESAAEQAAYMALSPDEKQAVDDKQLQDALAGKPPHSQTRIQEFVAWNNWMAKGGDPSISIESTQPNASTDLSWMKRETGMDRDQALTKFVALQAEVIAGNRAVTPDVLSKALVDVKLSPKINEPAYVYGYVKYGADRELPDTTDKDAMLATDLKTPMWFKKFGWSPGYYYVDGAGNDHPRYKMGTDGQFWSLVMPTDKVNVDNASSSFTADQEAIVDNIVAAVVPAVDYNKENSLKIQYDELVKWAGPGDDGLGKLNSMFPDVTNEEQYRAKLAEVQSGYETEKVVAHDEMWSIRHDFSANYVVNKLDGDAESERMFRDGAYAEDGKTLAPIAMAGADSATTNTTSNMPPVSQSTKDPNTGIPGDKLNPLPGEADGTMRAPESSTLSSINNKRIAEINASTTSQAVKDKALLEVYVGNQAPVANLIKWFENGGPHSDAGLRFKEVTRILNEGTPQERANWNNFVAANGGAAAADPNSSSTVAVPPSTPTFTPDPNTP